MEFAKYQELPVEGTWDVVIVGAGHRENAEIGGNALTEILVSGRIAATSITEDAKK